MKEGETGGRPLELGIKLFGTALLRMTFFFKFSRCCRLYSAVSGMQIGEKKTIVPICHSKLATDVSEYLPIYFRLIFYVELMK